MKWQTEYCIMVAALVIALLPVKGAFADTIPEKQPTPFLYGIQTEHSPRRAAILSAVLPGTGQAYNRKYWKMPIVYAAGITGGYMIHTNAREWRRFRQAFIYRNDDNPDTVDEFPVYSSQQLQVFRDNYRRNLELSVILTTAFYLLQILDATVDAHLFDFDVTNQLTLSGRPTVIPSNVVGNSFSAGVSLTLSLKDRHHHRQVQPRNSANRYVFNNNTIN